MNGYIHSTDSFGTVDGPGIRFVVFLQGCPLRCKYCHNPDTWKEGMGEIISVKEIMNQYNGVKSFTKGGITVTGGEPLLQMDFVTELFEECKKQGVHTCIDTSGITFNKNNTQAFDRLMKSCDLVMLDLKHIDSDAHSDLTGQKNENILDFARYLSEKEVDLWVRHVVIKGITLNDEMLNRMGLFLSELKNVKALDIIPYHKMGNEKYKLLGIKDPLEHTPPTEKEESTYALNKIIEGIKEGVKIRSAKK